MNNKVWVGVTAVCVTIIVILLMFLVSVTTIVRVGKRPKNKTTTAGKTVKEIIKKAININTFWKRLR